MTTRRYDIDWLRVIAIGLLLIYHIAIGFQPWGVFIGFIQSEKSLDSLWIPMSMLNIWRIPLLFFVSGMGVSFAIRKRNWKQLLLERSRRIFLPFLFGIFFIVPVHVFLWRKYYNQDLIYSVHPGHLWFLANIFIYVILLTPLFFFLKSKKNSRINTVLNNIFRNPLGLLLIVGTFCLETLLIKPDMYEMYAMTLHGFLLGLLAFFFGFICVQSGNAFWHLVQKWRWLLLSVAVMLYFVRFFWFDLKAPSYIMAVESNTWILAVFGFAYKYLNHPSNTLRYLSEAAYPVYIIHMIFLYLGAFLIFPLHISTISKFILVVAITGVGCFTMYELLIRRVHFLRPLFGLRKIQTRENVTDHQKSTNKYKVHIMKKAILIISILSLFSCSCKFEMSWPYTYQSPEHIGDVLHNGSMEEVNLETRWVVDAVNEIREGRFNEVHSFLIFKDGALVQEE